MNLTISRPDPITFTYQQVPDDKDIALLSPRHNELYLMKLSFSGSVVLIVNGCRSQRAQESTLKLISRE
jgi:hypothetical protein